MFAGSRILRPSEPLTPINVQKCFQISRPWILTVLYLPGRPWPAFPARAPGMEPEAHTARYEIHTHRPSCASLGLSATCGQEVQSGESWAFVGSARLWPSGPAALWPSHLTGHPLPATASQARISFPITIARCPVQQTPSAVALGKPNVAFPSGWVGKGRCSSGPFVLTLTDLPVPAAVCRVLSAGRVCPPALSSTVLAGVLPRGPLPLPVTRPDGCRVGPVETSTQNSGAGAQLLVAGAVSGGGPRGTY